MGFGLGLGVRDRLVISSIALAALVMGTAVCVVGADKVFRAGAPDAYAHQESEKVTVGAKCFDNEDLVNSAFGKKIDFAKYGVVPVLLVVENKRPTAVNLEDLEESLVATDGRHAKAVAPEELPVLATAGKHPNQSGVRYPVPLPKKKNPLTAPEIATRAFAAKVLAPGDTASGFIYFEAQPETGDRLYVNGMRDARSGQDLLYFEFPLKGGQ